MPSKRSTEKAPPPSEPATVTWLARRNLLWLAFFVATGAISARVSWMQFAKEIRDGKDFVIATQRIKVTPPPQGVRIDLSKEITNNFDNSPMSLLDANVVERVGQTLALHPWVSRVKRVQKHYPGELWIDVDYRQPVAAVEVETPKTEGGKRESGVFPIDATGVVLNKKDLPEKLVLESLLRIYAFGSYPSGDFGSKWDDEQIVGAAKLAGTLANDWNAAGLYRIEMVDGIDGRSTTYHLFSRSGDDVVWGSAPGREAKGEPAASQKLAVLRSLVQTQGRFGLSEKAPRHVDLRDASQASRASNGSSSR
jgi:hypothetical protein